ncbi:MAG: hypothetical protein HOP19_16535 [Acidobacteria bacterium]|nr:hypothetical protein [Acidobacteriota bacterium]
MRDAGVIDRVPIRSGRSYCVTSPAAHALVTRELADELSRVLERFAVEAGFDERRRVSIYFQPGIFGHHALGRAVDIYAVGGVGIGAWKQRWDEAGRRASQTGDAAARQIITKREPVINLGWRLYKALQLYGRWAQPYGFPIQLFGPWTRREGPWRHISDRMLRAHLDHIHVAK